MIEYAALRNDEFVFSAYDGPEVVCKNDLDVEQHDVWFACVVNMFQDGTEVGVRRVGADNIICGLVDVSEEVFVTMNELLDS